MKPVIIGILLSLFSGFAFADCYMDGKSYPEKAVVGSLQCQGGKWVSR